jgi:hypothetical protein
MESNEGNAYEILFIGPAADTVEERERVIQGLQARFSLPRERATRLVQRAPLLVKKGLTGRERDRYVEVFESIGAKIQIREYAHGDDRERESRPPPYPPGEVEEYCPWEDMENLGFFQAFLATLREVLLSPAKFYHRMPTRGGMTNPLIFALILGVLGKVFGLTWQQVFSLRFGQLPEIAPIYFVGITVVLPFIVLISLYIGSAIVHTCLTIVGGNRRGFEVTFRVIAYSGATEIFYLIPFVGGFITFIYTLAIVVIGLRESHGTGTGRAVLAIFLPVILILAMFLVAAISLFYKLSEFL